MARVSETLRLTVVYEDSGDGWVMASIPGLAAVLIQGATLDEARTTIHSEVRDWLESKSKTSTASAPNHGKVASASRWTSSSA